MSIKLKTLKDLVDLAQSAGYSDLSEVEVTIHDKYTWTDRYPEDFRITEDDENVVKIRLA